MFHKIPQKIQLRMSYLEDLSRKQKEQGVESFDRLRQIPQETGRFIAILAALSPRGKMIEIGTSGGYSALWLSLACQRNDRNLITFEISEKKVKLATETFKEAGLEKVINIVEGDARSHLEKYKDVSFCFLDCEKEYYMECYELVIRNMVKGGILVADNAISHEATLQPMLEHALKDDRVNSIVVPIGNGELVSYKI
ncbi:class I SAM-dependent methyltransferase [bacterium]|nr:class I SAM-dependent methyltransferase [bacterium]